MSEISDLGYYYSGSGRTPRIESGDRVRRVCQSLLIQGREAMQVNTLPFWDLTGRKIVAPDLPGELLTTSHVKYELQALFTIP